KRLLQVTPDRFQDTLLLGLRQSLPFLVIDDDYHLEVSGAGGCSPHEGGQLRIILDPGSEGAIECGGRLWLHAARVWSAVGSACRGRGLLRTIGKPDRRRLGDVAVAEHGKIAPPELNVIVCGMPSLDIRSTRTVPY